MRSTDNYKTYVFECDEFVLAKLILRRSTDQSWNRFWMWWTCFHAFNWPLCFCGWSTSSAKLIHMFNRKTTLTYVFECDELVLPLVLGMYPVHVTLADLEALYLTLQLLEVILKILTLLEVLIPEYSRQKIVQISSIKSFIFQDSKSISFKKYIYYISFGLLPPKCCRTAVVCFRVAKNRIFFG